VAKTTVIVSILLAAAALCADMASVAIVDLEAINCDDGVALAVSEYLRTEISSTGGVRVIERAQLDKVMEEQAFQVSGLVDVDTAVELGKLLGVEYVGLGSVSRLGDHYTISLRFISVETAETELGETAQADDEGGLFDACTELVEKVAEALNR
jgi:TolB-like protein